MSNDDGGKNFLNSSPKITEKREKISGRVRYFARLQTNLHNHRMKTSRRDTFLREIKANVN